MNSTALGTITSTNIPSGAALFNAVLHASLPFFEYIPQRLGLYEYEYNGMISSINVICEGAAQQTAMQ